MKNALILHGTDDTPDGSWIPWLASELRTHGYTVTVPQLPDCHEPDPAKYLTVLQDIPLDGESVIIGHSSGAVEILHLLASAKIKVKAAYLVAPFIDNIGWKELDRLFPLPDLDVVRSLCQTFTIIHSDNDPYCPMPHAAYLTTKLGAKLYILPGQKHFSVSTAGERYRQFPELLQVILDVT